MNGQTPPSKECLWVFCFSEMSFSWIEGWFGLFPHCLILNSDEWSCVYAQTSPKGWRAGCGKHCSTLNLPGREASQLHLRGRMNPQRLRGRRTLGLGCQRAWVGSSIKVIPPACSRQPWMWIQQKLSQPFFPCEKQWILPTLQEIKWTDKALNTVWGRVGAHSIHVTLPFSFSHEQRLALWWPGV